MTYFSVVIILPTFRSSITPLEESQVASAAIVVNLPIVTARLVVATGPEAVAEGPLTFKEICF